MPLSAFATNNFVDMFIGGGTTGLSGTYNGSDYNYNPQSKTISAQTGDFIFGTDYSWVMNGEHTFWMGIGSTISMAFPSEGSVSPETMSIDIPFEYLFSHHFSIVVKPSLLGAWLPAELNNNISYADIWGYGFSISVGPACYFDENENFGLCVLVGYKYLTANGTDDNGLPASFAGGGIYAQLYFSFELDSN